VNIESFNNYSWGRFDVINNYSGQVGYIKDVTMIGRVTVFRSGKMISTGARSLNSSVEQLKNSYHILLNMNLIRETPIITKTQNIVATSKIKDIPFHSFIRRQGVIYEPDQFVGAIYKTKFNTTMLVFTSGSVVITGAKEESQLVNSIKEIIQFA
jgi:transcription initiation factor TFIID TATA-box-binding protein